MRNICVIYEPRISFHDMPIAVSLTQRCVLQPRRTAGFTSAPPRTASSTWRATRGTWDPYTTCSGALSSPTSLSRAPLTGRFACGTPTAPRLYLPSRLAMTRSMTSTGAPTTPRYVCARQIVDLGMENCWDGQVSICLAQILNIFALFSSLQARPGARTRDRCRSSCHVSCVGHAACGAALYKAPRSVQNTAVSLTGLGYAPKCICPQTANARMRPTNKLGLCAGVCNGDRRRTR